VRSARRVGDVVLVGREVVSHRRVLLGLVRLRRARRVGVVGRRAGVSLDVMVGHLGVDLREEKELDEIRWARGGVCGWGRR
jgi:hypothetical protein